MNVVSFGGGTNSTAMIIGMYLHKIPIDLILFADTGGEQPHTYEFMGTFNEWLVKHGIPKIVSVEYHVRRHELRAYRARQVGRGHNSLLCNRDRQIRHSDHTAQLPGDGAVGGCVSGEG